MFRTFEQDYSLIVNIQEDKLLPNKETGQSGGIRSVLPVGYNNRDLRSAEKISDSCE